jgi:putative two-component system response regulator
MRGDGTPIHLLLIEDDPDLIELLRLTLARARDQRYTIQHATTLTDGEAELEAGRFDLVLLDLSLPDSQGLATLEAVLPYARPTIVLTGSDDEQTALEALHAGAQDYLTKDRIDLDVLERAVAYAMAHHRSEARLREAMDKQRSALEQFETITQGTIIALLRMMEMRDPYTAGHQRRVARIASEIAGYMALPKKQIDALRYCAFIHDIGKIRVPSEILAKPGRLTRAEHAIITTHASVGAEILHGIEFPWPVEQVVLQHHERMDGTGYPNGAAAGDIVLEARIIAVADVIDAMASDRPYRPALGVDEALAEIAAHRGARYDADVCDAVVELFGDGFRL